MTVKTQFPRPIRRIDHVWIPLADGTRPAVRIWQRVLARTWTLTFARDGV